VIVSPFGTFDVVELADLQDSSTLFLTVLVVVSSHSGRQSEPHSMRSWTILGVLTLSLAYESLAFKAGDFKTCSQSGFCRRGRALSGRANEAKSSWVSPYSVDPTSVTVSPDQAVFTATVKSTLYPDVNFGLEVRIQDDGVARIRMDEVGGIRKRYDEAAAWALIAEPTISKDIKWTTGKKDVKAVYGDKKDIAVVVNYEPLRVTLLRHGKEQIVLNGQGLLHMEHSRNKAIPPTTTEENKPVEGETAEGEQVPLKVEDTKVEELKAENPRAWFEGESEDALWEETFLSWTDSKPKGNYIAHYYSDEILKKLHRSGVTLLGYFLP